ncbi:uncharacterized protein LOC142973652 [Anticarsia gemmatalis]|uniref:uncharacterized protein LOC142973652 n=1 Tax=Anticarsia gemmatalis TaxID=129554 RepID=UPI003F77470F
MTIPPFPSQDLAKLVLGYLAEEQLMTAYDEFLQASPYLDAVRNEYDRIFMTSLRNILAEYRAVKIYVETCKPFILRKKLVQCANLLEVVKVLVSYTDANKLQSQDGTNDKFGLQTKQNTSTTLRHQVCEVCASLNLANCVCKNKSRLSGHTASQTSSLENSVETTALEDLPGNHITTRKKYPRVIDKDTHSESNLNISESSRQNTGTNSSNNVLSLSQSSQLRSNESSSLNLESIVTATNTPECREKIEEFNTILNKVCNTKSNTDTRLFSIPETETLGNRVSNTGTFHDFATGVSGHENRNDLIPDSSTSENLVAQTLVAKDNSNNASEVSKAVNEHSEVKPSYSYPRIKPKPNDQKIKIISDIKVDSPFPTMTNATSTPLMQTIVINGTPAYKQKLPVPNNNYTKDEIMAMPTIIVVPTSAPSQKLTQTKPALSQKTKKVKTKTVPSARLLGPLVIDVSSSPAVNSNKEGDTSKPSICLQDSRIETGLVKTVDVTKNASVPKDNTIPGSVHNNTPQILPPVRKSSSTPRRNSHIRVLDFTTPRRILHETIHEKVPEETNDKSVEIVITRSPSVIYPETANSTNNIVEMSTVKVHKIETCHINNLSENTDAKSVTQKKSNWDADLRALATANEKAAQVSVKKPRIRNTKKKIEKSNEPTEKKKETNNTSETKKSRSKRKSSPKGKKTKRKKLEEEEEQYNESNEQEAKVAIKPTFNIVMTNVKNAPLENTKTNNCQNKSNNDDANETPEAERISLQNEIGAKLNISDFLETPYKQALYDIQMETPKFLGSVLPDEPISDIKIMNIPTPRFFDTPKPVQATPSYSSRATDYSSGGSYYKPDEQDYLRIPDLECPVTSSKEELPNHEPLKEIENDSRRSSRPIRKCTKNVSYKAGHKAKSKEIDDKIEIASNCSDSTSINSSLDNSREKVVPKTPKTPKTPKDTKSKLNSKLETKKKLESCRKRKSPVKKDKSIAFMKIKPRRPTPTKENNKKIRRKTSLLQNASPQSHKKRASGKQKTVQVTPIVTSAPTKSRRKSSTPRKLHCTKQFNSESSADSPEINVVNNKITPTTQEQEVVTSLDSDTEQLALRWSDDGSQDAKQRVSECEDISKIKEYIEASVHNKIEHKIDYHDAKGTLQVDLIKRGFDAETAKIIERDLLDAPTEIEQSCQEYAQVPDTKKDTPSVEKNSVSNSASTNDLQSEEEAEEDDLELSVSECNEGTDNYIKCISDTKDTPRGSPVTLKDAWSMEVCIEDGLPIRLRATNFNLIFDNVLDNIESGYSFRETEIAVSSISNMNTLYTPLKDRRTQCYEIFDSTLTSLDTPLKLNSPKERVMETTEIEIVVEEEKDECKDKVDGKKRKRLQNSHSSEECLNESKKSKPEAQYLFNSTNIQNIDIESVLKKLHGPC